MEKIESPKKKPQAATNGRGKSQGTGAPRAGSPKGAGGKGAAARPATPVRASVPSGPPLPKRPPRKVAAEDDAEEKKATGATAFDVDAGDPSQHPVVLDETALLERVSAHLTNYRPSNPPPTHDYQDELLSLRDQISVARLEDVPSLVEQMERIQGIAARRAEISVEPVDPQSPYFGHVRLREEGRGERDVLVGKTTHVDSKANIRIVDWRHAPVSQIYYKYDEGTEYEETLGDREVLGQVMVRRTVTIVGKDLRRVSSPQGIFVKGKESWRRLNVEATELSGGQGVAVRPDSMRGVLGMDDVGEQRENRHLPEIAALLDPRQFELISKPDSGLVCIQGGAGSGKTTIGVHRLAYLAYQQRHRFAPEKMLVIVASPALRAYIGEVLPALGLDGLPVETYAEWAKDMREKLYGWLDVPIADDTPSVVTRLKTSPVVLHLLEERAAEWRADPATRKDSRGIVGLWAEVLTDKDKLIKAFRNAGEDSMPEDHIVRAWRWCADRCPAVLDSDPGDRAERKALAEMEDAADDEDEMGADNQSIAGDDRAYLDPEDDALLLRAYQLVKGELRRGKNPVVYEHLFVDEAQDLSPLDLGLLLSCVRAIPQKGAAAGDEGLFHRSATLAGDTAQRLHMDAGFTDWRKVLDDLGMKAVDVEPLRIAYRSTRQVLELARAVLGPLADPTPPLAPRTGAPVELHEFPSPGAAVAFLGDALRPLFQREPLATVAILARHVEQADVYYGALKMADIPNLRRVRHYEFAFRPGVEVTEIRQVKGLEYDYVILVDVNASTYGEDPESRHLLHIGATRAAHQLWIMTTGERSKLLPDWLNG